MTSKQTLSNLLVSVAKIEDVYNVFMFKHEPELMTAVIPSLDEWYRGETEQERTVRGERYVRALEMFLEKYSAFVGAYRESLYAMKDKIMTKFKKKSQTQEEVELEAIERSLDAQ